MLACREYCTSSGCDILLWSIGEMMLAGKTELLGEPPPVGSLCASQLCLGAEPSPRAVKPAS
jgi:hypothetical protein